MCLELNIQIVSQVSLLTDYNFSFLGPWNDDDATDFLNIASEIANSSRYTTSGLKPSSQWHVGETLTEWRFLALFCLTASGVFNPLCAFQGGVVAQECVKAITQKFTPIG